MTDNAGVNARRGQVLQSYILTSSAGWLRPAPRRHGWW